MYCLWATRESLLQAYEIESNDYTSPSKSWTNASWDINLRIAKVALIIIATYCKNRQR